MNKQHRAAALTFVIALIYVALEIVFDIQTGLPGVAVMGMAGGFIMGDWIARDSQHVEICRAGGKVYGRPLTHDYRAPLDGSAHKLRRS